MTEESISVLWLMVCSCLVLAMQAGFLCLECGMCRHKNYINVAIKNITDFIISFLIFSLVGYAIMLGGDSEGYPGIFSFPKSPLDQSRLIFQSLFCGTAITIVSGAVAERVGLKSYLVVCTLLSVPFYPAFAHLVWYGELREMGYIDFAGASVVHGFGGMAALITAVIVGPRDNRFKEETARQYASGSNLALSAFGTILLIFGWLGFNGGSFGEFTLAVPSVIWNTLLGAVGGCLFSVLCSLSFRNYLSVPESLGSTIAGLVSITAGCHLVTGIQAFVMGFIGGAVYWCGHYLLERFKVDDVVGAIPAHMFAGIWAILAVPLFKEYPEGDLIWSDQMIVQLTGLGVLLFIFGPIICMSLLVLNRFLPLRISQEDEEIGLNITEHNASDLEYELLTTLEHQSVSGDLQERARVEPFTQVGRIATLYNAVVSRLEKDQFELLQRTDDLSSLGLNLCEVAHDLRDPLQVINNCLYLLNREMEDSDLNLERIKSQLSLIGLEGTRIENTVALLQKSVSKAEPQSVVDLKVVVDEAIVLNRYKIKKHGVKLTLKCPANKRSVFGRKTEFVRVASNLISNAIDAIMDEGWIEVCLVERDEMIELSVMDSGPGIPDSAADSIFKLFYTTKGPDKGTGLGLNIAKKIVQQCGGTINLDKNSAHTRFVVLLPIAHDLQRPA